jgi:hypothetical protein
MEKILLIFLGVLLIGNVLASQIFEQQVTVTVLPPKNVAYIYDSLWSIDSNIVSSFSDLNFSVDYIRCKDVSSTDFSQYGLIFVGNEELNCSYQIPVDKYSSVIMNGRDTKDLGLTSRTGASKIASNVPLKINVSNNITQVYTIAEYNKNYLSLYFLPVYYSGFDKTGELYLRGIKYPGLAISHINAGTTLTNGKKTNSNICFFGLYQTEFWTDKTKELFNECAQFAYKF